MSTLFILIFQVSLNEFFPNEALIWCGLEHPNIVPLLGLVRTGCEVVFFSEYQSGSQTLQDHIDKGALGQGRALAYMEQILRSLDYLHKKNHCAWGY